MGLDRLGDRLRPLQGFSDTLGRLIGSDSIAPDCALADGVPLFLEPEGELLVGVRRVSEL